MTDRQRSALAVAEHLHEMLRQVELRLTAGVDTRRALRLLRRTAQWMVYEMAHAVGVTDAQIAETVPHVGGPPTGILGIEPLPPAGTCRPTPRGGRKPEPPEEEGPSCLIV